MLRRWRHCGRGAGDTLPCCSAAVAACVIAAPCVLRVLWLGCGPISFWQCCFVVGVQAVFLEPVRACNQHCTVHLAQPFQAAWFVPPCIPTCMRRAAVAASATATLWRALLQSIEELACWGLLAAVLLAPLGVCPVLLQPGRQLAAAAATPLCVWSRWGPAAADMQVLLLEGGLLFGWHGSRGDVALSCCTAVAARHVLQHASKRYAWVAVWRWWHFCPTFCCRLLLARVNPGWGLGVWVRGECTPSCAAAVTGGVALRSAGSTAVASTQHLCGCSSMIVAALLLDRPLPYYYHCSSCSVSAAADHHASVCVPSCVLPVVLGCVLVVRCF